MAINKNPDRPKQGVNFRIDDELRKKLERAAIAENRTLSAEIEQRLKCSFEREDRA